MAGILPIAYYNNNIYFLFGRETMDIKYKDSGKWSDFGGSYEKDETKKETAIREGFEETMGFIGSENDIKNLIEKKLVKRFFINKYTTFVVKINYDENLPSKYKTMYEDAKVNKKELVFDKKNGLYEKDEFVWIKQQDLLKNINIFRPFYKYVVKEIYYYFNKME